MKLNRRQLRRLIHESISLKPSHQEAVYAIVYTSGYLDASDTEIGNVLRGYQTLGQGGNGWQALDDVFGKLNSVMIAGASAGVSVLERQNPELDLSEELDILREGHAAGQADWRENPYKYIERVIMLVNDHTPIGMSASDALGIFGHSGGGVLFRDTAIADAQHLISLMNDDNVLSWLDNTHLESMVPVRRA